MAGAFGVSNDAARDLADLKRRGLLGSVPHATELISPTRRHYVTSAGLKWLAEEDAVDVDDLLDRYPRLPSLAGHLP